MRKLIIILLLSLAVACTSTTEKVERSDKEVAATIKADNEKLDAFMKKEDENGASLDGLIDFGFILLDASRLLGLF